MRLRLLAAVLNGLGEQGPVYASDFARYQKILADLSREEIIVLATALKHCDDTQGGALMQPMTPKEFEQLIPDKLAPRVFPTAEHVQAQIAALFRTGLLRQLRQSTDMDGIPGTAVTPYAPRTRKPGQLRRRAASGRRDALTAPRTLGQAFARPAVAVPRKCAHGHSYWTADTRVPSENTFSRLASFRNSSTPARMIRLIDDV